MSTRMFTRNGPPQAQERPAQQQPTRPQAQPSARPTANTLPATPAQNGDSRQTSSTAFGLLGAEPRTVAALAKLGIDTPTLIQERAIPPLLAGHDVVGQSRTGSGKTIAFGLPLVQRIDPRLPRLQALILVPTRELAGQVAEVLTTLDGGRGLRIAELIGGRSLLPQRDALRAGAQIAVGAPGRVLDHLRQGNLDLSALRIAVLDEADQMLDAGFAPDVERILSKTPPTRQMALFTATLPDWTIEISRKYLREPVRVDAGEPMTKPTDTVSQIVYAVPQGMRFAALVALLDRRRGAEGTTLVFGRTKHGVKKLAKMLEARGYPVAALQGNMSQNARDRVVADFRAGRVPVMLATNVAARGLDVLSIEQVINFELPESAELFTHRIGRTGRMDREGEAITLLTPEDLPVWQKMQRDLGLRLAPRPWPQDTMPLPDVPPVMPPDAPRPQFNGRSMGRPMQQRGAPRPAAPAPSNGAPYAPRQNANAADRSPRPNRGWQGGRRQESAS